MKKPTVSEEDPANGRECVSVGEELFLVHLRRHEGEEPRPEDFDWVRSPSSPKSRKRSHSIGEELWEIHLKRSQGMDPDQDKDEGSTGTPPSGMVEGPATPRATEAPISRYNLRKRARRPVV